MPIASQRNSSADKVLSNSTIMTRLPLMMEVLCVGLECWNVESWCFGCWEISCCGCVCVNCGAGVFEVVCWKCEMKNHLVLWQALLAKEIWMCSMVLLPGDLEECRQQRSEAMWAIDLAGTVGKGDLDVQHGCADGWFGGRQTTKEWSNDSQWVWGWHQMWVATGGRSGCLVEAPGLN